MVRLMSRGDLPKVKFLGRPVKPVGLGVSILMLTLFSFNIFDAGVFGDMFLGDIVAVSAAVSAILLFTGWIKGSQKLAIYGFLLATITYMTRSAFIALYVSPVDLGVYAGLGAAVIAGGSFLLETWDEGNDKWNQF